MGDKKQAKRDTERGHIEKGGLPSLLTVIPGRKARQSGSTPISGLKATRVVLRKSKRAGAACLSRFTYLSNRLTHAEESRERRFRGRERLCLAPAHLVCFLPGSPLLGISGHVAIIISSGLDYS